jgi:hypothetical protein
MKSLLLKALVSSLILVVASCNNRARSVAAPICGVFSLRALDSSIHHGVDLLVINPDSTYVHFYTGGSSGKNQVQSGSWTIGIGKSLVFKGFIAWDLFGPMPDGVMYPDPANTAFPISQASNGSYEIDADPDRGEKFVQIQKCNR